MRSGPVIVRSMHPRYRQFLAGLILLRAACLLGDTNTASQLRPWLEYHTIMWTGDTVYQRPEKVPLFFQRLREMGINTAMVSGDGDASAMLTNHFPYYVENLVNRGLCLKYNSKVRNWDKFVTDWARGGRPESALVRDYCLDDTVWRNESRRQVQGIARKNVSHQPLAYNLRDELSTTISANPFDYDFNPVALAKFRAWLKTQYGDVASLNAEWETDFAAWDDVKPFTTDQIKNRMASGDAKPRGKPDWQAVAALKFDPATARQSPTRWNFAPWADFRTYMDISLADALAEFRRDAHEPDPHTPVGIEGTQMPSAFGGYDLWRLSQALDWMEPYDIGCSREILGSFMPGKPVVTTVFENDTNHARRRLWHLLLEGDRGCIVWWSEDCIDWKSADYALTAKAKALAPALNEMTSPLAQLFLRAERLYDPVLIHYSQASIQADWLLESTVDGSTWLRRFSSYEAQHNRQARVRDGWLKAFQDLGYSPRFISSEEIEAGKLRDAGRAALVLPDSLALSDKEIEAIRNFLVYPEYKSMPRAAFCDGSPGMFDAHGRLRKENSLEQFFPNALSEQVSYVALGNREAQKPMRGDIAQYPADRLKGEKAQEWSKWLGEHLAAMKPEISLPASARVRVHRFQAGRAQLVAFERNIDYQMSEDLKQAGGNEALEHPVELEAALRTAKHVYDLRTQKYLGQTDRIRFTIDPWQPSLFALTDEKLPEGSILAALAKEVEKAP